MADTATRVDRVRLPDLPETVVNEVQRETMIALAPSLKAIDRERSFAPEAPEPTIVKEVEPVEGEFIRR